MLANDQIKMVAESICRAADRRLDVHDDRFDRVQLWAAVRHACRAIEAVAKLEDTETAADRSRGARYLVAELEAALESARKAKVVLEWAARREANAH